MKKILFLPAFCFMFCAFVGAQETSDDDSFQPRLPPYFRDIISEQQRDQIYDIQKKYFQQINPLRKQIAALEMKERSEIEAILTAEQRDQLKKTREEARRTRNLTRDLTPEQRRAAQEAARNAFLEAVRKAQEEGKPASPEANPGEGGAKTPSDE